MMSVPAAFAQDEGEREPKRVDLSASFATGREIDGEPVRMLIGDVRLNQDQTVLLADSATQYTNRSEILFEGNVLIFERGDTLRSDAVLYDRVTKVGRATGNVRLTDGEVRVTAPSATYYTSEKRTTFNDGVSLVDSASVLTSRTGTYWSEQKRAEFAGSVVLDGDDTDVRADSLTYLRETEVSIAAGNVYVESYDTDGTGPEIDTTSVTIVVGDWAFTDDPAGVRRIRENVLLFQVRHDSTETDTLLISSDALESTRTDSTEFMSAAGSVLIWNPETSAVGDSVASRSDDLLSIRRETIEIFGSPIAWFGTSQVSGNSLVIKSTDGSIDTLRVLENTILADRDSVLDRIHQVSGRNLLGLFFEDSRREMIVGPNAESIYYLRKENRPDGAVRTSADRIVFELQDDDLKRIRVEDGVEGTYYPEELLPADMELAGFRWVPERRPDREALLANPRLRVGDVPSAFSLADRNRTPTVSEIVPAVDEPPATNVAPEPQMPVVRRQWVPGTIDTSRRGYTIVVASRSSVKEALDVARSRASGVDLSEYPVDILKAVVAGRFTYRVCVGAFASRSAANQALRRLNGSVPADSWILAISPDM
jgi:lipopolysaccharide export system protein LptA